MANLEVRIRHANDVKAMPFAEIPFRLDLITNVVNVLADVGGTIGDEDLTEATLMYQIADDGEKAYLEVVVG
jgi:hypothetical protein